MPRCVREGSFMSYPDLAELTEWAVEARYPHSGEESLLIGRRQQPKWKRPVQNVRKPGSLLAIQIRAADSVAAEFKRRGIRAEECDQAR